MSRQLPKPEQFSRFIHTDAWQDIYAGEIVAYIASDPRYDVTLCDIRPGEKLQEYVANYVTAREILDRLAELCGYVWWVDPANRLHFGPAEE